jgi:hypothetical protein
MRVVLGTRVHFEAGCPPVGPCLINEDHDGTLTATIAGTLMFPDSDGDSVPDRTDNCRFVANPDQTLVPTPVITAPADRTLASCVASALGAAAAADRCDGGPVTVTHDAPATFAAGPNVVTWTAQDAKGRQATDTQTVTVVDTTDPMFTFVPPAVSLNDCGPANLGQPTAVDDCAGAVTFTNDAPASFPLGPTVVTWTATDPAGNKTTATQNVTVTDTVPPLVSCDPTNPQAGRSWCRARCLHGSAARLAGHLRAHARRDDQDQRDRAERHPADQRRRSVRHQALPRRQG